MEAEILTAIIEEIDIDLFLSAKEGLYQRAVVIPGFLSNPVLKNDCIVISDGNDQAKFYSIVVIRVTVKGEENGKL